MTDNRVEAVAAFLADRVGRLAVTRQDTQVARSVITVADEADTEYVRVPRVEAEQWRRALAHEDENYVRVPRKELEAMLNTGLLGPGVAALWRGYLNG